MNKQRMGKLALLMVLLCTLCLALSGCIVDPDKNDLPDETDTWKRYTEKPSDQPTATVEIVTPPPSDDPNVQSWTQPSGGIPQTTIGIATIVPSAGVTSPSDAPSGTPTDAASGVLKRGMQGDAVKNVQAALKRLGYFEGKTDGDFGEYTENAIKEFQRVNGLTADGIVGQATLNKLSSSSAKTAPPKVTATPTVRVTATPKVENVYLSRGDSGTNVTKMQNRLLELGYIEGSASGKVCAITEEAIIAFQQRNGLDDDGVAGPGTLKKLYSSSARKASKAVGVIGMSLKKGSEGDAVRLLQNKLKQYGFLKGSVDGDFGQATEDAVEAFQRANGLYADGKAGAATLEKLFSGSVVSSSQSKVTDKPTSKPTNKPTNKPTAKATKKPTPTPNAYIRVTARPDGEYFTLEKGMMGEPVKKLQRALRDLGYYEGKCDGYYGDDTVAAVKRFQRDKGLSQDGKAGRATQRYLYEGDYPDKA